jgi:TrmH family RNA methyltransferase
MTGLAFNNPKIQRLRRLIGRRSSRVEEACFVVEGPVLASEAVAAGWDCRVQYVPAGSHAAVPGAGEVCELADGVLERVAATDSPRPPLVEVGMPAGNVARTLERAGLVVVLDRVADPGNLGTILRSAEAAGVEQVVLTPGSTDAYSPKSVRASAGALFHVPVLTATLDEVGGAGFRRVGTSSRAVPGRMVVPHTDLDWSGRVAIVMGNEAAGLPDEWNDDGPIDAWVTIEHRGRSESLNVAMAATLLVFEAARRRDPRYSRSNDPEG